MDGDAPKDGDSAEQKSDGKPQRSRRRKPAAAKANDGDTPDPPPSEAGEGDGKTPKRRTARKTQGTSPGQGDEPAAA